MGNTTAYPTLEQYLQTRRDDICGRYGLSEEDFHKYHPRESLVREWFRLLDDATTRARVRLPDAVLDSFVQEYGEDNYLRTFRGVQEQPGYLLPRIRDAAQSNTSAGVGVTESVNVSPNATPTTTVVAVVRESHVKAALKHMGFGRSRMAYHKPGFVWTELAADGSGAVEVTVASIARFIVADGLRRRGFIVDSGGMGMWTLLVTGRNADA